MNFYWLWIVPVLGVLVIVHEMGHFFTARWLGIKVEEFGIGFPPRAFAIRRNGIDYSVNWLPIGGFVKILGENGESDDPASFGRAPAWKRAIVLAAGATMNLVLAFLIFAGLAISGTNEVNADQTGVSQIVAGRPAEQAGMQPGDHIVSVAGQAVHNSDEVRALSRSNAGKPTDFVVERNGQQTTLKITPDPSPPDGQAFLGIGLDYWVSPVKVGDLRSDSAAAKAGLQRGDEVVSINGTPVTNLPLADHFQRDVGGVLKIIVKRNGETVGPLSVDTGTGSQRTFFAFSRPFHTVHYSPTEALGKALGGTWLVVSSIPRGIGEAVSGHAQGPGVTGPVGIAQLTGEVAQQGGLTDLLNLMALLSISLFLINLLPLPALDGGRLLFVFLEVIRGGRRIAPEKEGMVHFAGMMVLLAFMAIITIFDVQRLFEGTRLLP